MTDYFRSIISDQNIEEAMLSIKRSSSAGPDGKSFEKSIEDFKANKAKLTDDLARSAYHTSPPVRVYHGEKKRPLDIMNIQDRIVQRMFSQVLSRAFDAGFSSSSHGFRPERGRQTAVRQALDLINSGSVFLVQLDISKYFQNIDRQLLMNLMKKKIDEPEVLNFISDCISVGHMENGQLIQSERGIPQGSSLSPLLSNIYLNELDQELDSRRIPFIRFADDVLILTAAAEQAQAVKSYLESWLPDNLGLSLSEEKTKIVSPENCQILGYRFLNTDQGYLCDPPLPEEKKRSPKAQNTTPSAGSRRVMSIAENSCLDGLNDLDPSSYKNKWIPKEKAQKIRDAINTQFTVAEMASALGFTVLHHSSETLTLAEHDSCIIWPESNKFKRFSQMDKNGRTVGGGPLDFYMHFKSVPYFQALNIFEKRITEQIEQQPKKPVKVAEELTPLQRDLILHDELKRRNKAADTGMRNVFAYLIKTRKIDSEIVSEQVKKGCLQQITDKKGQALCVFIGRDENGLYSSICFRSTSSTTKFMGDFPSCDYERGWFFDPEWDQSSLFMQDNPTKPNPGKLLLCFESYIEMLSYMTILKQQGFDYRQFAYLSCGSVTKSQSIESTCERYGYTHLKVMFNNDLDQEKKTGQNPGKEAAERVVSHLKEKGLDAAVLLPSKENDWNDTLVKQALQERPAQKKIHDQQIERNSK